MVTGLDAHNCTFIGMSTCFDSGLAAPAPTGTPRVEGKNKGMRASAGGPFTQSMEHHPSSKTRIPTYTARPYVDYRVCRLAGIVFGNPSVALSLVVPRRGHRARINGRAYWHRASQARTLNYNPAPEAEAVPLCTLAA